MLPFGVVRFVFLLMIKVMYKSLLKDKVLTATDKILLSFLISKARSACGFKSKSFWDDKAKWNEDVYWEVIGDNGGLPMPEINNTTLAKEIRITRRSVIASKKRLEEQGYIVNGVIYGVIRINEDGYFELSEYENIKGELWIFFSWLQSLCELWEGDIIDASVKKLALLYGDTYEKTEISIRRLLQIGVIQRVKGVRKNYESLKIKMV